MTDSGGQDPERMLSAALRAQASGGGVPRATGATAGPRPAKLPVVRVLLAGLVLGVLAGALAAFLTLP